MNPIVLFLLIGLPVFGLAGVAFIVWYGSRRMRRGQKPHLHLMFFSLVAVLFGMASAGELLVSDSAGVPAAEKTADKLLRSLRHGDLDRARGLLTPSLAERLDLSEWKLHRSTRWELAGKDAAAGAIRLFYFVDHLPEDRQTLYLGFAEQDGSMAVSSIDRVYHLPRTLLAIGKRVLADLAQQEGRLPESAGVDSEAARRFAARLRRSCGRDAPRWRVVSFSSPLIQGFGRVQLPPRMWVRWETVACDAALTVAMHFEMRDSWKLDKLQLSD